MKNVDPSLHYQENGNLIKKYKTQELDILKCKIEESERVIFETKQKIIRNRMKLNKLSSMPNDNDKNSEGKKEALEDYTASS